MAYLQSLHIKMGRKKSIWINIYKKELALNWFLLVTLLVQWSCKLNEAAKVLAKDWAPRSSPRGASGDWQTAAQRPSTAISSLRSPQTCLIIPSRTPLECDTALVLHRTRCSWERLSIALYQWAFEGARSLTNTHTSAVERVSRNVVLRGRSACVQSG